MKSSDAASLKAEAAEYHRITDGTGPNQQGTAALELWRHVASQPITEPIVIGGRTCSPDEIEALPTQDRSELALRLVGERGMIEDLAAALTVRERYYHEHPELAAYVDWTVSVEGFMSPAGKGAAAWWKRAAQQDSVAALFLALCHLRLGDDVPEAELTSVVAYESAEPIRRNRPASPNSLHLRRLIDRAKAEHARGNGQGDALATLSSAIAEAERSARFQA